VIAALYVQKGGIYFDVPDVDPWDVTRDARLYDGPWPVVAHPPCERWGRYWSGGPNPNERRRDKGDDDGCFRAALRQVRTWGGVLEHPADSHAWRAFGLPPPPPRGWQRDVTGGWCCRVEQGHYGHRARKATWLYYVGPVAPPALRWGPSAAAHRLARLDEGFHSTEERRRAVRRGTISRLSKLQRAATPAPFRDVLLQIARLATRRAAA